MKKYFKSKVKYLDIEEGKRVTKNYLIDAVAYSDAEANMISYLTELEDINSFEIKNIDQVYFDEIIYNGNLNEFNWYSAKVKIQTEESGDAYEYLVAGEDIVRATKELEHFLSDSVGNYSIKKLAEVDIQDIVLYKYCEIVGTIVISFLDQREIDLKQVSFEDLQAEENRVKESLGAFHLTRKKYSLKIADNPDNLKKLFGKKLGQNLVKVWMEDFIDEDSGEVLSIERKEVVVSIRSIVTQDVLEVIKDINPDHISLYREF